MGSNKGCTRGLAQKCGSRVVDILRLLGLDSLLLRSSDGHVEASLPQLWLCIHLQVNLSLFT